MSGCFAYLVSMTLQQHIPQKRHDWRDQGKVVSQKDPFLKRKSREIQGLTVEQKRNKRELELIQVTE